MIFRIYVRMVRKISAHFRRKRMAEFCRMFSVDAQTRIVDVGGTRFNWNLLNDSHFVTLVNLSADSSPTTHVSVVVADGRLLPFSDKSFDICFSNSVIEHLGTLEDMALFANEIRRVGARYYVQTPDRFTLVEPHLLFPFAQFVPRSLARRVVRWATPWGWAHRPSQAEVDGLLSQLRLLTRAEMQRLFPEARIVEEKVFGLRKALIAIHDVPAPSRTSGA